MAVAAAAPQLGNLLPLWSVVPFVLMLLAIAVLPLVVGKHWDPNLNKASLSALLGAPVAIWTATLDPAAVVHAGGVPRLVRAEENGLLVEPGSTEELTDALARLLGDKGLRHRLRLAGQGGRGSGGIREDEHT